VTILADAHRMNENAANAFLKTLEEPAPSNILILVTANLNLILPTIRSRCQVIKFFPLTQEEMRGEMVRRGFDADSARLLSYYPGWSLDQLADGDWQEFEARRAETFALLSSLITQSDVEDVLLRLYDRSRSRELFLDHFRSLVNAISVFLRDLLVLAIDRSSPHLANVDYRAKLAALVPRIGVERILFLIRKMEMLLRDMQRNLNARVLILEFINSFAGPPA
jgi:DNA polymerase-3 subunit delta'